ncbi:MAG: Mfa1 fimbrilin C-terminal domain-containing protein [Alistipes sp.]|nr:Mfa1 fimbrilin C-terminal domain-containing protein [Alistipes sp.]
MKKYIFLAIALLGLASCAKEDLTNGNEPIHNGEIEESYIAINLSASDITRAEGDDAPAFEDGEEAERAVSHADFFFFDEAGNPFAVTGNPATTPGGGINHLRAVDVRFGADNTTEGDDISDSSNAVLLLSTYKGHYPSQIVAVLNWSPSNDKSYSLNDLHDAVAIQGSFKNDPDVDVYTNYFVMSNAVYAQGTTEVCATPLTIENIKTTEKDALAAPVNIYVERVAAKVSVIANETGKYLLTGEGETGVYAQILGWDLYRDNPQSKLLKDIDPITWTADDLGFNWNDSPWYRSYWATSLEAVTGEIYENGKAAGAYTYIGENTTGKETCTKAVIKAQLVKKVDGVDKPLELAIWNNVEYVEDINLRTAVANTLKNTYFAKTGEGDAVVYTGLKPEDLVCKSGDFNGVKANEVYFQLSTTGKGKNWYKLVDGKYEPVANDTANDVNSVAATNAALKSVPAAVLYEDGYTFYYVDIKHLGASGKDAEYGIVRNHIYNVTINSITGYGSPVYTGTEFIDYPQISDQKSFVSAQINILSWRLVNQVVDIQPNN